MAPSRERLPAIDVLRGLVMAVMALDHVRDFFSRDRFDPTDLARASGALFATRWVTHFCAPVFLLLAGTSFYFSRGGPGRLALRGLWLILLELTVVTFAWFFTLDARDHAGAVIFAIGGAMLILAPLARLLPPRAVGLVGVAIVALHGLGDGVRGPALGWFRWPWALLESREVVPLGGGVHFFPFYPVLPWAGVMAAGFGLAPLLERAPAARRRLLVLLGLGLTAAFVALRAWNGYGDPAPWAVQPTAARTVMSFLNCTKYPPSLDFLLMTLGPALALLGVADRLHVRVAGWLETFGRVPFFYYLLHLYAIHLLALAVSLAARGSADFLLRMPRGEDFPFTPPPGYGYGLPVVYAVWLAVVAALYPACRWFAGVKRRRRDWWLSYL